MLYAPDEFDSSVIETFSVLFGADVHRSCKWSRGSDNPDHINTVHILLASKTIFAFPFLVNRMFLVQSLCTGA